MSELLWKCIRNRYPISERNPRMEAQLERGAESVNKATRIHGFHGDLSRGFHVVAPFWLLTHGHTPLFGLFRFFFRTPLTTPDCWNPYLKTRALYKSPGLGRTSVLEVCPGRRQKAVVSFPGHFQDASTRQSQGVVSFHDIPRTHKQDGRKVVSLKGVFPCQQKPVLATLCASSSTAAHGACPAPPPGRARGGSRGGPGTRCVSQI